MDYKWDLNAIYEGHKDPKIKEDIAKLEQLLDQALVSSKDINGHKDFAKLMQIQQDYAGVSRKLLTYSRLMLATNTKDSKAAQLADKVGGIMTKSALIKSRIQKYISENNVDDITESSDYLRSLEFILNKAKNMDRYSLSEPEEELISKMNIDGASAWSNLYNNLTSKLIVDMPDGEELPLPAARSLANNPDPETRKAAYFAELRSYKKVEHPLAAAITAIKGAVNTQAEIRGYESALDLTLQNTNISEKTLNAMISAMEDSLPALRRYMKAKSRLLGHRDALPFFDILAPIGDNTKKYTQEEAEKLVVESCAQYSKKMADIAQHALDNKWVDSQPRSGKVGGAFCSSIPAIGEYRVLTNFGGDLGSVFTLAHELGHGYHAIVAKDVNVLNLQYPMTLAETASIFAETILANHMVGEKPSISVLDSMLKRANQVVTDIYSRFVFEKSVFEKRKEGVLFSEDLCDLMIAAQKKAYGDGLDEDFMHPYMWACKVHYYSEKLSYYNFPYAFGYLFAAGLYPLFLKDKEGFREKYDQMLMQAGSMSVEDACAIMGIDSTDKNFWLSSFAQIEKQVDEFENLVVDEIRRKHDCSTCSHNPVPSQVDIQID